jgi:protein-S-isoprenylcysteine O-methyltransferase Ste14
LIVGSAVYIIAFFFWLWSTSVNRNFEMTVRLQKDRDHKVCTSGPYRIVRHPAYVAGILMFASVPLALSSYWCIIPGFILVIALIIRTSLEDKFLHRELEGYEEFAKTTKYRLLPLIW